MMREIINVEEAERRFLSAAVQKMADALRAEHDARRERLVEALTDMLR